MKSPTISQQRCFPDGLRGQVAALRRQVERLEKPQPLADDRTLSTGAPALDGLLPGGGLRRGSLVEYLSPGVGSGTGTLALGAAREACVGRRALVVVDRRRTFYPPAAMGWRDSYRGRPAGRLVLTTRRAARAFARLSLKATTTRSSPGPGLVPAKSATSASPATVGRRRGRRCRVLLRSAEAGCIWPSGRSAKRSRS
jgi:hypothetical protein